MTLAEPTYPQPGGCLADTSNCEWAREWPRRRFASPYGTWENMDWLKNFLRGPSRRWAGHFSFLPREARLNDVDPVLRIAFIGDLMPTFGRSFQFGGQLREFLRTADYLVVNLEGVISDDRWVWNSVRHERSIIPLLSDLFPSQRTVVSVANNHAADCGWNEFMNCIALLSDHGFTVIGRRDCPVVHLGEHVELACCTFWSNQRAEYVARLEHALACRDPAERYRVLYPHWGYELQLYPHPRQQSLGTELLGDWDCVIGHHSHCPQPVVRQADRLAAYSLGNFLFGIKDSRYHYGIVLRLEIGPGSDGKWRAGNVAWHFTQQCRTGGHSYEIRLATACPWFGAV